MMIHIPIGHLLFAGAFVFVVGMLFGGACAIVFLVQGDLDRPAKTREETKNGTGNHGNSSRK